MKTFGTFLVQEYVDHNSDRTHAFHAQADIQRIAYIFPQPPLPDLGCSSCCRVGPVHSAWSRTCLLGWTCTMQILHNISKRTVGKELSRSHFVRVDAMFYCCAARVLSETSYLVHAVLTTLLRRFLCCYRVLVATVSGAVQKSLTCFLLAVRYCRH